MADAPGRRQRCEVASKDDVAGGRSGVDEDDVRELVEVVAEHAHDRGDAAAASDEQDLAGARRCHDEVASGVIKVDEGAGLDLVDEMVAHEAAGDRFDRDRDAAVGAVDERGQRVGAPVADPVDLDADADVLAWGVASPASTRVDDEGRRVGSLKANALDATGEIRAGAERADEVEGAWRQQGLGQSVGDSPRSVTQ